MNITDQIYGKVAQKEFGVEEAVELIRELKENHDLSESLIYLKKFVYDQPLLKDHQIFGKQILMGVAHCSLAINAVKNSYPEKTLRRLEKVSFSQALSFETDEEKIVYTLIKKKGGGISFETRESGETFSAASGDLSFDPPEETIKKTINPQELFDQASKILKGEEFYNSQDTYGPSLFSLKQAAFSEDGVLGEIKLSPAMKAESEYLIHPAIFDAGYVNSLFAASLNHFEGQAAVPLFIRRIEIFEEPPPECYCHSLLIKKNQELIVADNYYYDKKGKLLMLMEGLSIKRVASMEALIPSSIGVKEPSALESGKAPLPKPRDSYRRDAESTENGGKVVSPLKNKQLVVRIEEYVEETIKPFINNAPGRLDREKNFMDLGVDSSRLIEASQSIESDFGIELYPTLFFEYQNIRELSEYFAEEHQDILSRYFNIKMNPGDSPKEAVPKTVLIQKEEQKPKPAKKERILINESGNKKPDSLYQNADIAVIGMAGRLPQAQNLDQFWENIHLSKDLKEEIPENHWDYKPWFSEDREADNKTYSKWGYFLKDADKFDSGFFGVAPRQADWLDPQLRLLLEVIQETAEDAGLVGKIKGSDTGVYVGVCFQEYWDEIVRAHIPIVDYQSHSSAMSSISGFISYTFDLQGGSIPLDNACASSLTALHLACESLKSGQSKMAFVAGSNLLLSPLHYVYFSRIQALSPSGRCHSFDAQADGYTPGEGVAAVLLKPLEEAIKDNDNIHAVIKGTAINHTGRSNNPTSPRPELQTKLLLNAWRQAGVNPEQISYLEAHGTGTKLGDPIEVNAVKKAFKSFTGQTNFCALGSAKAHIGHLEGAAGLVSVIKVILSMKNKVIPKMPAFKELNPYIKLEGSPLYINRETQEWKTSPGVPRLAGVSSFGMTGNNAHAVIEEYADHRSQAPSSGSQLIALSAKNEDRLKAYAEKLVGFLEESGSAYPADSLYSELSLRSEALKGEKTSAAPDISLSDLAYTL